MSNMRPADVAQHINRLPWETWLSPEGVARHMALPDDEMAKVLRAGRRKGTVTVRHTDDGRLVYKRIRLHPLPSKRLASAPAMAISSPSLERR